MEISKYYIIYIYMYPVKNRVKIGLSCLFFTKYYVKYTSCLNENLTYNNRTTHAISRVIKYIT